MHHSRITDGGNRQGTLPLPSLSICRINVLASTSVGFLPSWTFSILTTYWQAKSHCFPR